MRLTRNIIVLTLLLAYPSLWGQGIPWKQQSSFQFAQEIPLRDLLEGFFGMQDINVVISELVTGTVNGTFEDQRPEDFLDQIARAYGLTWYYNANVVYIYKTSEVSSETISIRPFTAKELLKTLHLLGIVSPSASIRILESGLTRISGPKGYVELVKGIAEQLNTSMQVDYSEHPTIRIFPMKYAWAYDTSFTTQQTVVTVPGVASVLRGLMETGTMAAPSIVSGVEEKAKSNLATKQPKAGKTPPTSQKNQKAEDETNKKDEENGARKVAGATLIQADTRLNAVIVRDVEERMAQYEAVIKALDVPVHIIEISASIVDVNKNFSRALGNKFISATSTTKGDRSYQLQTNAVPDTTLAKLTKGINFQPATAVVNGYEILAQIEALEVDGHAETLSRPSILTLNNIEAVISSTNTFYVSIAGTESTDLTNVTVGTTLKVTPRVIEEGEGLNKIKLLISIEDGSISATDEIGGVPRTQSSSINTQAVIYENQSLLIGGTSRQTHDKTDSGIPFLKDIPILGYAFKRESITKNNLERMYLITPRIVHLDQEKEPHYRKFFNEPIEGQGDATRLVPNPEPDCTTQLSSSKKSFKKRRFFQ